MLLESCPRLPVAVKVDPPAGVAELKKRLPYADLDKFAKDPKIENISDLFTVGMIVKFMEAKLAAAS